MMRLNQTWGLKIKTSGVLLQEKMNSDFFSNKTIIFRLSGSSIKKSILSDAFIVQM